MNSLMFPLASITQGVEACMKDVMLRKTTGKNEGIASNLGTTRSVVIRQAIKTLKRIQHA